MNKKELAEAVAAEHEISVAAAGAIVSTVFATIEGAMKKGDSVQLIGFGSFSTRKRAARTARNPSNGATIKVPAATVPVFKAGKGLKEAVNKTKKK